jgi:hypothetical protein
MDGRRSRGSEGRRSRTISVSSHHTIVTRRDPITLFEDGDEKTRTIAYLRATIALAGSIFLWVGAWNLCTEGVTERHRHGTERYVLLPRSYFRHMLYLCTGFLSLVICDTLYSNAGFTGYYWGSWVLSKSKSRVVRAISRAVHVSWALAGMFLFWVALYDLADYTIQPSLWKDLSCLCLGIALLIVSNTFYHMAFLYPEGTEEEDPTTQSSIKMHVLRSLKALLSMCAQTLVWLGSFHILEMYIGERSMWREICFTASGLFLMRATNTYIANSYVSSEFDEAESQKPSFVFFVKCLFALSGQLIFNTGAWTTVDTFLLLKDSPTRDLIYICVGVGLLLITGNLANNAAVYETEGDDDDEYVPLHSEEEATALRKAAFRSLPSTLVNE